MDMEYRLTGNSAASGIAIGPALIYTPSSLPPGQQPQIATNYPYREHTTAHNEVSLLDTALAATDAAFVDTQTHLKETDHTAESHIFQQHRDILHIPELRTHAVTLITRAGWRAADAIIEAGEQLIEPYNNADDPYINEYSARIRDVVGQVRRFLAHGTTLADRLLEPAIVVADDLGLSEWMTLPREKLLGLALASGCTTAHSIIMARSLGIPTLIDMGSSLLKKLNDGDPLALDATNGQLIVDPTEDTKTQLQIIARQLEEQHATLRRESKLPAVTRDGQHIRLLANVATVVEARTAHDWGAEGVGSLRTELLFLGRPELPDEEEQIKLYHAIANELPGTPIVARTLDIGGDKYLPAFPLPKENNPFLGWRGIRIGLTHPEAILMPQLRAMLRAGAAADIRIVLPMIATLAEIRRVKAMLHQVHHELQAAGIPCAATPQLGVMIEIPAAAIAADSIARECDFVSIGSNDLIQYTMACDRTNQRVAHLNHPLEPAVLALIHTTIQAAHRYGKKVSLCGAMASDPALTALLIGMGIDELSCSPDAIPLVRAAVRDTVAEDARQLANKVREASSLEEVLDMLLHRGDWL